MATAPEVAHYKGPGGVVWTMALPLDKILAKQERKGILRRVNPDGTPYAEPAPPPPAGGGQPPALDPPAQSAVKAEWVGYAVRAGGLTVDDAEALTKQDLIDRFGRPPTPPPG
jgi:hypothetical protein